MKHHEMTPNQQNPYRDVLRHVFVILLLVFEATVARVAVMRILRFLLILLLRVKLGFTTRTSQMYFKKLDKSPFSNVDRKVCSSVFHLDVHLGTIHAQSLELNTKT